MSKNNNYYGVDYEKEKIIIDKNGFQVMMEWEKPYMEALIDNLQPTGDVLEIGFGLGYSATQIQKHPIKSYTVIECDPEAIKRAKKWAKKQPHPVNIIHGYFHIEIHKLNQKFDAVFFDDSPSLPELERDTNFDLLLILLLTKMANVGCKLSWYSGEPPWWNCHPATKFSCKPFEIQIPEKALYFSRKIKKNNTLFMPLLEYPYGSLTPEQMDLYLK